MKRAALVYQGGIANVFEVQEFDLEGNEHRKARRLLQHGFDACAWYVRGLSRAGVLVRTFACNMAGDITTLPWTKDLDSQPFSDKFEVV